MRGERKPRARRAPRAKPTPPAPLPEGRGEKEPTRDSATSDDAREASRECSPPPVREGGPGGVGSARGAPVPHLVTGQRVDADKVTFARQLRREMTPAETALWQHLRASRLNGLHFRRQQLVHGFIADFYCHAAGAVVEVDGGVHNAQLEYDQARDLAFAALGLLVLRVRNDDVLARPSEVLGQIVAACESRLSENL